MPRNLLTTKGTKNLSPRNFSFEWFVDRSAVRNRVDAKIIKILARVGAFGRKVMRNSIRPPRKKDLRVEIDGVKLFVPYGGLVVDDKTKRPVHTALAKRARFALREKTKFERAKGNFRPPRQGPSNLLRKFINFGVNPNTEQVVIGAWPFPSQPNYLVDRVSVPELLDKGGSVRRGGQIVKYAKHPFTQPAFDVTLDKMQKLIKQIPL